MIKKIGALMFAFILLFSVSVTAATDMELWFQNGADSGKVETEFFASASNGTVSLSSGVLPSGFNGTVVLYFEADPGFEYGSYSAGLSDATERNPGMDAMWSNSGDDASSTPNIVSLFDLNVSINMISSTEVEVTLSISRNENEIDGDLIAHMEPELSAYLNVTFNRVIEYYNVTATSDTPGAGAVFSGEMTNVPDGTPYDVSLVSYDDVNYIFNGFNLPTSGTIEGADVNLIASFTLVPPIPETFAVRVESDTPAAGAVFSGYGTGFADGEAYNVTLDSYDSVNYTFTGFSPSPSGNIAGADVDIIATFEPVPIPETYTVSATANLPGATAVFTGTGTGFLDGAAYDVILDSYDTENFVFIGWSESPTGTIAGADVALIATFEEIIPEEDIPEEEPEPEPEPEPEEEFLDEETPEEAPDALPETGGLPLNVFSLSGLALVLFGFFVRKK